MTTEYIFEQSGQKVQRPFSPDNSKSNGIAPRPIERPQIVPPIRKSEVEKHHIKRTGKR